MIYWYYRWKKIQTDNKSWVECCWSRNETLY